MVRMDLTSLKAGIDGAHSVAVLLPRNSNTDAVAASLALKLGLESLGKSVSVACTDPMTVAVNRLVGVNTITNTLGGKNLVITFPGQTEIVDKISYSVENGELQLVIVPKANSNGIDFKRLNFVTGGTQAELVFLVGVSDLTELGQLYLDARDFLHSTKLVYINTQTDPESSSISETVTQIFSALNINLSNDAASNLLLGLEDATDSFRGNKVTATTFEMAAFLVKNGAKRQDVYVPQEVVPGTVPSVPYSQPQPVQQPQSDWLEPKIYSGTSLS